MNNKQIREIIIGLVVFILGCLIVVGGMRTTLSGTRTEGKVQLEKALKRAIVECYALEGAYPPDIAYMENHYGIVIDGARFTVHYEAFAENIMPDFKVIEN